MTIARRRFLQTTMGLAAGWALHEATGAEGSPQAKKIPIALQLYAVRGDFARDVPGTLKAVGKLGYEGVEFWGYGGEPKVFQGYGARQLRKLLAEAYEKKELRGKALLRVRRLVEERRSRGKSFHRGVRSRANGEVSSEQLLIEPLIVYPHANGSTQYVLLDGHIRLAMLKEMGQEKVNCLVSLDDEAFTYIVASAAPSYQGY